MKLPDLTSAISQTHITLQSNAIKAINRNLTLRNWLIGFYIIEFEQKGEDRAQYGTNLLKTLEAKINTRGLTETLFKLSRQFYITYPEIKDIVVNQLNTIRATVSHEFNLQLPSTALSIRPTVSDELQNHDNQSLYLSPEKLIGHLSFSHIAEILPIENSLKRLFYETEAIKCNWSVRELRRQINTQLYERCAMSLKPEKLISDLQNNTPQPQPADIIKHPFTFEFLGLKAKDSLPFLTSLLHPASSPDSPESSHSESPANHPKRQYWQNPPPQTLPSLARLRPKKSKATSGCT